MPARTRHARPAARGALGAMVLAVVCVLCSAKPAAGSEWALMLPSGTPVGLVTWSQQLGPSAYTRGQFGTAPGTSTRDWLDALLSACHIERLEYRLSRGTWNTGLWGAPADMRLVGPPGLYLEARFASTVTEAFPSTEAAWAYLVHGLGALLGFSVRDTALTPWPGLPGPPAHTPDTLVRIRVAADEWICMENILPFLDLYTTDTDGPLGALRSDAHAASQWLGAPYHLIRLVWTAHGSKRALRVKTVWGVSTSAVQGVPDARALREVVAQGQASDTRAKIPGATGPALHVYAAAGALTPPPALRSTAPAQGIVLHTEPAVVRTHHAQPPESWHVVQRWAGAAKHPGSIVLRVGADRPLGGPRSIVVGLWIPEGLECIPEHWECSGDCDTRARLVAWDARHPDGTWAVWRAPVPAAARGFRIRLPCAFVPMRLDRWLPDAASGLRIEPAVVAVWEPPASEAQAQVPPILVFGETVRVPMPEVDFSFRYIMFDMTIPIFLAMAIHMLRMVVRGV